MMKPLIETQNDVTFKKQSQKKHEIEIDFL